jgi:hypothetical protein
MPSSSSGVDSVGSEHRQPEWDIKVIWIYDGKHGKFAWMHVVMQNAHMKEVFKSKST